VRRKALADLYFSTDHLYFWGDAHSIDKFYMVIYHFDNASFSK